RPARGGLISSEAMLERELRALDSYQLIPRALHQVTEPDMSTVVLGRDLLVPMIPRYSRAVLPPASAGTDVGPLAVIGAELLVEAKAERRPDSSIAMLPPSKMAELVPAVRELAELGVACVGLD